MAIGGHCPLCRNVEGETATPLKETLISYQFYTYNSILADLRLIFPSHKNLAIYINITHKVLHGSTSLWHYVTAFPVPHEKIWKCRALAPSHEHNKLTIQHSFQAKFLLGTHKQLHLSCVFKVSAFLQMLGMQGTFLYSFWAAKGFFILISAFAILQKRCSAFGNLY